MDGRKDGRTDGRTEGRKNGEPKTKSLRFSSKRRGTMTIKWSFSYNSFIKLSLNNTAHL